MIWPALVFGVVWPSLAVGFAAGYGWAVWRRGDGRYMPAPRPPKPVCGCGHHHSFHDPGAGKCGGTDRKLRYSDATGVDMGYHDVPCTCRQYSGPVPLPEYVAPEIAP